VRQKQEVKKILSKIEIQIFAGETVSKPDPDILEIQNPK
jgi:hypothetical protein